VLMLAAILLIHIVSSVLAMVLILLAQIVGVIMLMRAFHKALEAK